MKKFPLYAFIVSIFIICIFTFPVSAQNQSYFSISTTSITDSKATINVLYTGPAQQSAKIEIQSSGGYSNSSTFTAIPGQIFSKTYSNLPSGKTYLVTVSGSIRPLTTQYISQENFTTTTAPVVNNDSYFEMKVSSVTDTSATVQLVYTGPSRESAKIELEASSTGYRNTYTFDTPTSGSLFKKTYSDLTANTNYVLTVSANVTPLSTKYIDVVYFSTKKTPVPPKDTIVTGGTGVIKDPAVTGGNGIKTPCTTNCDNQNSNFQLNVRLNNPLKVSTITEAIKLFMNIILKIALPFIIIFFIWSGLKFILALGKPEKITEAKKMFWYTIIGTLLILGAWTITNAIIGTVNALTS